MRVDRDILIGLILKHKSAFFALLDYLTIKGKFTEIPQKLYLDQYYSVIVASGDEKAKRLLTLDNLHKSGIFVHLDNRSETLVMQSFLIEMLRFIDKSRIRELSRSDFELLRQQFEEICKKFEHELPIIPGHKDYEEAQITLFELIDNTLSKIQQNVEALDAHADRLAQRYDKLDAEGHNTIDSMKLLDDASSLYERFIKPCMEFLTPNINMTENRLTFSYSMERLASKHENCGYPDIGLRISYKTTAIRSYYKNISDIEQRVKRYYNSLASERLKYAAIEQVYNRLQQAMSDLRHGNKLRNTKLPANAEVFARSDYLLGLQRHFNQLDTRINWYETDNQQIVEEWLNAKINNFKTSDAEPVCTVAIPGGLTVSEERRQNILKLCMERRWPDAVDDILMDAHLWLKSALNDYKLLDLLVAYQYIYSVEKISRYLKPCMQRHKVHDDKYHLHYLVMQMDRNQFARRLSA